MSEDFTAVSHSRSFRQAALHEAGIWRSLFRWLTNRPRSDDRAAVLFGYASQVTPILLAFIALSVLEIPILPLLLPWPTVRYSLLALGVLSLLWMLGFLAAVRVHPHVVSHTELRLRSGFQFDTRISWDQISDIRLRRSNSGRKLQVERSGAGQSIALQGTTNLEVAFHEPVTVRFIDGRRANVDVIHFYADAPTEFITAARGCLADVLQAA
jgi:hypothetical protein